MMAAAVIAFGAVSALGEGIDAILPARRGERAREGIARDPELAAAGLARPFAGRASVVPGPHRVDALLERALLSCAADLDRVRPGWRTERVGLVLGTSSGGMRAAEQAFAALSRGEALTDRESPTYFGPVARAARRLGLPVDPAMVVLGACVSSALAVGLATRWLARGSCDVALAGGFDEVTVFVAAGFEALRATTAAPPPRPFRLDRDGMSLGEGAAVLALTRPEQGAPARFFVRGFGASSDAVHLTAPERSGDGLARAAERALEEAGSPRVDLVGAHATATPFNDPAEWRAMERALGASVARAVVTHPFKAQIGHALGAAGALELLACARALEDGILPPAAGTGELDPQAPARLLDRAVAGRPRSALKLASAFGGANAALVVGLDPGSAPPARARAFVHDAVHVNALPPLDELALRVRVPVDRLARADALVHWALAAVASLRERCGPLGGAGVVVGSALATLETNGAFAARIRERGARAAEPRLFPYTSPNAVAGECSIAFGLTGPSFTVGGGMHAGIEALAAAALLVEAGDAERVVVVAADHVGALGRAMAPAPVVPGAVATLVSSAAAGARARVGAMRLRRGAPVPGSGPAGHEALLPLVAGSPRELVSVSAPDAEARIELEPV